MENDLDSKQEQKVRHVLISAEQEGQRLDNFLSVQLRGIPRSLVYRLIRTGQVRINGGRAKPGTRISAGDQVRIPPARVSVPGEKFIPAALLDSLEEWVLLENQDFLVVNKPPGIAVHGGSGLAWGLIDAFRQKRGAGQLELVHRIDRETSGCLLMAKHPAALNSLRKQFSGRHTVKKYLCLMLGRLPEPRIIVDQPLIRVERGGERMVEVHPEGKPAQTGFHLLRHYGAFSFAEAVPHTGRTHQIRVHASFLGCPLAGDRKYAADPKPGLIRDAGLNRLFLHAHVLEFEFPQGHRQQVNAPLPEDLRQVLDRLDPG